MRAADPSSRPTEARRAALAMVWCALVGWALVAACTAGPSDQSSTTPTVASLPQPSPTHAAGIDLAPLVHKVGVYALTSPADLVDASRLGVRLVITHYGGGDSDFDRAISRQGLRILDSRIQRMLYDAVCPDGPKSCRELTPPARQSLLDAVAQRAHAAATAESPVVGYYLLDDPWTSFARVLPDIYRTIRSVEPHLPTVCGVSASLSYTTPGDTRTVTGSLNLSRALKNYSPAWCDAVLVYSYAPGFPKKFTGKVDWPMVHTLPAVLRSLRARGWDPTRQPLLGVPQAFGFDPRVTRGGARIPPEYRPVPTAEDLRAQVSAFCAHGASSIVAYAWNDGSTGKVRELSNSAALRAGLADGISDCRRDYWSKGYQPLRSTDQG